jgi:hypothetical protein
MKRRLKMGDLKTVNDRGPKPVIPTLEIFSDYV